MTIVLGVRRLTSAATHSSDAVYESAVDWTVRGFAPGPNTEGFDPSRDSSTVLWTVYADATSDVPTEMDLVVLAGDEYAVEGRPADWTHGPWPNPAAGVVVQLKRVEG